MKSELTTSYWTQSEAIELCRKVEEVAAKCNWHVALTGGCLYKEGPRKDVDLLFYKVRQNLDIENEGLLGNLLKLGFNLISDHNWCVKAAYNGKSVDLFFPENGEGVYPIVGVDIAAGDDKAVFAYYTEEEIAAYRKQHGATSNPPPPVNVRPVPPPPPPPPKHLIPTV